MTEGSFVPENEDQRRALEFLHFQGVGTSYPKANDSVGDFRLEEEIGRGATAIVYRARQESLGRSVALKLVPLGPETAADERPTRLEREARLLAALRHRSIVTVHAAGTVPGFRYIAMDLIEGTTLRELIRGRGDGLPCPGDREWPSFLLEVLHELASALCCAHAKDVIHRDIKPANVLIDREGRPFLADFGLAREEPTSDASITRGFVGTPQYASPEQVRGDLVSPASDVFSFGAMAFEAICGRAAFRGKTTHELLQGIQRADPVWPRGKRVQGDLKAVVEKCLEKRPADRYATGQELEGDLTRILDREPVLAAPRGRISKTWGRVLRYPERSAAVAFAALFCVAAFFGLLMFREVGASDQRLEAERLIGVATGLFEAGSSSEYRQVLERAVELEPLPGEALGLLADDYLRSGEFAGAHELYERQLRNGSSTQADRVGLHLATALREGGEIPPAPVGTDVAVTNRDLAMRAEYHRLRGEREESLAVLDVLVERQPASFVWRQRRAPALFGVGRRAEALQDLRVARMLRPSDLATLRSMAATMILTNRRQEAEYELRAGLEVHPDEPLLLADLALCLTRKEPSPEGTALARRAFDLEPRSTHIIFCLASCLTVDRSFDEARTLVDAALVEWGQEPSLIKAAALLDLRTEMFSSAEGHARALLALGAEHEWHALYYLAQVQRELNQLPEAVESYHRLEEIDPENEEWPTQRGQLLVRLGRIEEAQEALEHSLGMESGQVNALLLQAAVFRRRGQPERALDVLQRALGLQPTDPDDRVVEFKIADVMYDLGQADAAVELYLPVVIEHHPGWFDAWILKALCQTETRDYAAAESAYRSALAISDKAQVRTDLAWVLDLAGREREAIEEYQKARVSDPGLPSAWAGEGIIRLDSEEDSLRDPDEALRLLLRAHELWPDNEEYRDYVERARTAARKLEMSDS